MRKLSVLILLFLVVLLTNTSCIAPKCKDDMAFNFNFDRQGRPLKNKKKGKKKDPPAILMKRCHVDQCKTKKIHCHGNLKYRGSAWWKKQNPHTGE
ncbi:MAG: hypothetical protein EAZ53_04635 [Bacteroidetes bacterium]|nr:MAG: hypothetical protein EAZ53_04635 [Bacteroidota bacterium]